MDVGFLVNKYIQCSIHTKTLNVEPGHMEVLSTSLGPMTVAQAQDKAEFIAGGLRVPQV